MIHNKQSIQNHNKLSCDNDIVKKVYSSLNKYNILETGNVLAILYSSGSDSSTLLHIINTIKSNIKIQKNIDISIILIHINYNLRGCDSIADKDFAILQSQKLGCQIFVEEIEQNVFDSGNLQKKARDIRYQYAKSLYKQKAFTHLLVAHNKNDYIETVLYKLIKGTSTRLPYTFKERVGYIVRPMLDVCKDEINEYIDKNNIEYRLDKSNEKNKYSRNKIRNLVLPVFDSISDKSMDNIIDFLSLMKQELKPLEKRAALYCKKYISRTDTQGYSLNIKHIHNLNKIIAFRIIARFVSKSSDIRISKKIIGEIYKIIISPKPNITVMIEGYSIEKVYDILSVSRNNANINLLNSNPPDFNKKIIVEQEGVYNFYDKNISISIVNKNDIDLKDGSVYLDIQFPFIIRSRKEADIIYSYPHNHKKSLRKIFIDSKIPIKIREKIPIIEYNGEIAAVAMKFYSDKQNRVANKYSINQNSLYNIIKIEIKSD